MRVFRGFDDLPVFKKPVVTVGSYDGVHAGHRKLLGRIVELARENGGESVVITFSPHPREVLGNRGERMELLNALDEKILLLSSLGIDNLIVAPFTEEFSRISSFEFVHDYLVGKVRAATLVVGFNHHFGHNHQGDFGYLERLREQFGFSIYEIAEQDVQEHKVSSTYIRQTIRRGDMAQAARFLGFPYFVIVRGGRAADPTKLLPPAGKYKVSLCRAGSLPQPQTKTGEAMLCISPGGGLTFDPPVDNSAEFIAAFS